MQTILIGADEEIKFWTNFVQSERFMKNWVPETKNPELRDEVAELVNEYYSNAPDKTKAKFLDVGSGVVSILRGAVPGIDDKQIVACDPLGPEYEKLFNYPHYVIVPPLPYAAEDLPFEDEFDIVYMRNAIDHSIDPVEAYKKLLKAVKPGGFVIVEGFENEADHEGFKGMHQWNVRIHTNEFSIPETHFLHAVDKYKHSKLMAMQPFKLVRCEIERGRNWFIWFDKKPE